MLYFNNLKHDKKTVVGFSTGHNSGCAIIHDGKVVSISEERLTRKKNSDGYVNSLFYCLKSLGIKVSDVDLFVSSSYHKNLPKEFMGDFEVLGISRDKFVTVDHHLSHAYTAYSTSSFNQAIVLVIDGLGNNTDTESYYIAEGTNISKVGGNNPERSIYKGIGRAYESFTNYIGWSAQEAGKTMGLAAYGKNNSEDINLYKINDNLEIESFLDGKYYHGAVDFVKNNNLNFEEPFSGFKNKDAAFYVQDQTEKIIIKLVNKLYEKYKIKNLCLSGGVFLNSIINKKILDETPIENIFIPPCCDDTGQPLGNAIWGYCNIFHNPMDIKFNNAYLGRKYSEEEILDVINKKQEIFTIPYEVKSQDIEYKKSLNIAKDIAELLSKNKMIGLFEGESEIGPRALGHRSIICAPYPADMKDILNDKIKHRESFRPFAPVVLESKVKDYFDLDRPSPFMLLVAKGQEGKLSEIPAVLHYDKTARVQTVNKETNGTFYDIVVEFEKITGIPVILNTSFNDAGEPIIESPKDAIVMFCKSKLDYLVLDDYIIWKK